MNQQDTKTALQQIAFDWLCKEYGTNWYSDYTVDSLVALLNQHAEEAKAEQREACARKVLEYLADQSFMSFELYRRIEQACLNAGVEE